MGNKVAAIKRQWTRKGLLVDITVLSAVVMGSALFFCYVVSVSLMISFVMG